MNTDFLVKTIHLRVNGSLFANPFHLETKEVGKRANETCCDGKAQIFSANPQ